MRASIREYGFAVPILARSATGEICDGHLRLKAGIAENYAEVPVIPCDSWTDVQVKAFRLMVNRSVNWADWNLDALSLEFAELKAMEFNLSLTGFDSREIDVFTLTPNPAEDEVPPVPETPVTRPGDLWLLGSSDMRHRVYCGDATKPEDVARLMDGRKADLVVVDFPYNVNYEGKTKDSLTIQKRQHVGCRVLLFPAGRLPPSAGAYEAGRRHLRFPRGHRGRELPARNGRCGLETGAVLCPGQKFDGDGTAGLSLAA